MPKLRHKNFFLLDSFSSSDILNWNQKQQDILDYGWDYYCYVTHQRSIIFNELKDSLATQCQPFHFLGWQRVVNYQYSLKPLSTLGSILHVTGGRFNIGDIDQAKFPRFAALYIAEDRETAYREKFGLSPKKQRHSGLSVEDLLFTSRDPIAIVGVKGEINQVLDLTNSNVLKKYFNLLRNIHFPNEFSRRAEKLNIEVKLPNSSSQLLKAILQINWRKIPMLMNIPADSQILGQVAYAAGIEAILYPSSKSKKPCLAIYSNNFSQSNSYVELEGKIPPEVKDRRLDCNTYSDF